MLGSKKVMLKNLISKEFSEGINKANLLNSLEQFINENYPEKIKDGVYFTYRVKAKILHELAFDIKEAGGLELWKKKIMMLSSPMVGALSPKSKKKS